MLITEVTSDDESDTEYFDGITFENIGQLRVPTTDSLATTKENETMTRLDQFKKDCELAGFYVNTYSPGDGVTRYRFFSKPSDYFGPESGDYTALGFKEADTYAIGRIHGVNKNNPTLHNTT